MLEENQSTCESQNREKVQSQEIIASLNTQLQTTQTELAEAHQMVNH